jgi:hypothetical protein
VITVAGPLGEGLVPFRRFALVAPGGRYIRHCQIHVYAIARPVGEGLVPFRRFALVAPDERKIPPQARIGHCPYAVTSIV